MEVQLGLAALESHGFIKDVHVEVDKEIRTQVNIEFKLPIKMITIDHSIRID